MEILLVYVPFLLVADGCLPASLPPVIPDVIVHVRAAVNNLCTVSSIVKLVCLKQPEYFNQWSGCDAQLS